LGCVPTFARRRVDGSAIIRAMTAWPSPSLVACLLLLTACPSDPDPQPADESSTGPGGSTSTGVGPGTTPQPTTVEPDSSSSGADTTATTSSTGPDDTTGSSGSTGPDDTTGSSSSTGPDDTTSSSSDASTSGTTDASTSGTTDASTSGTTDTGGSTTTGGDPCDAGDGPDFAVTNIGIVDYVINGVSDPPLTVVRGCSYTFDINAVGHPFLIKTVQGSGGANTYNDGVVGNGTQNGVLTWDVPMAAPDALFYNCQFHGGMTNTITVIGP
jgi:hypothetical protein